MVEFVVAKCPRCGADLDVSPDSNHSSCKFCQAEVLVVNDTKAPSAPVASGSDLEKKELAFQIAQTDYRQMETQSWQLKSRIDQFENPRPVYRKGSPMLLVYIFGIMAIFMTAMLGGLFYFLQIYYIYGLTKTTCPLLAFMVIAVSIVFIVGTKIVSDSAARKKYEAGLASPEYPQIVAQYNALQPKLVAAQAEVSKREQELRDFVK